jgi:2-polyprenyl-3-methyl-5-hydroxy-6-metoxy-1,4-benzoquinol methylase
MMNPLLPDTAWPTHGLEQRKCCPVCNSPDRTALYSQLRDRVFFCAPGTWNLYRCKGCGSGYLDPRPTRETIGLAYSRYFTHTGQWRKSSRELNMPKQFLRALSNGYFNWRFGTDFRPASALGPWLARLSPGRRANLDATGRHLPKHSGGRTLLDVGCGNGNFLEFAQAAGWHAEGLDQDSKALEHCIRKGLRAYHGDISAVAAKSGPFDVITLYHVIEHVHDPGALLQSCQQLLKPEGLLLIETPNVDSLGHGRYRHNWYPLDPPRHLVLFNQASLLQVLSRAGFDDTRVLPQISARDVFYKSEAIAAGVDPFNDSATSTSTRLAVWHADRQAGRDPALGEVVSLAATKRP